MIELPLESGESLRWISRWPHSIVRVKPLMVGSIVKNEQNIKKKNLKGLCEKYIGVDF